MGKGKSCTANIIRGYQILSRQRIPRWLHQSTHQDQKNPNNKFWSNVDQNTIMKYINHMLKRLWYMFQLPEVKLPSWQVTGPPPPTNVQSSGQSNWWWWTPSASHIRSHREFLGANASRRSKRSGMVTLCVKPWHKIDHDQQDHMYRFGPASKR